MSNTYELGLSQKRYYAHTNSALANTNILKNQIDNDTCRVWLEWQGYYYPSNGDYDCEYDAVPFAQLDQRCFNSLQGPYCHIPIGIYYVGQVNGFPWVAFGGLYRHMGGVFTASQIEKILDSNDDHNDGQLRSDLRAELVEEFLSIFPEFAGEIPIDYEGNVLTANAGQDNTAVVSHIIPRIAPQGNGAGRNAFSNAMVISQDMYDKMVDKKTKSGAFPSEGMLLYFEWLAEVSGAKFNAAAESNFTATYIRDPRLLDGFEVEYLSEADPLVAMIHAGMIRESSEKNSPKR